MRDELRYSYRLELIQDPALETVTFRHRPAETALPMRRFGSFLPGNKIRTENIAEPIPFEPGQEFVLKPDNLTYRPLYKSLKRFIKEALAAAEGAV